MYDPRIDKLAQVLVNYSVEVKKGDVVMLTGNVPAEPALLAAYRAVLKAGGHPWMRINSDAAAYAMLKDASQEQLAHVSKIDRYVVSTIDCYLAITGATNTRALTSCDPAKQSIIGKARRSIMDVFMKRAAMPRNKPGTLRWCGTHVPTQSLAQEAEMSIEEYAEFVFTGGKLNAKNPVQEWKKLSAAQKRLVDVLNKGKEMHITAPGGTDIRFGIKGRKWINCDGKYNFPDGEVFTAPDETATEGTVAFQYPAIASGREVSGIRLTFKAGRIVDATASKGEDYLIKMLDTDKGARILGELALGTNYDIQRYTRNTLFDEKIGGTFHMAPGGGDANAGSKNKSAIHWDLVCDLRKGGLVTVDGKTISKNGKFQNASWPK